MLWVAEGVLSAVDGRRCAKCCGWQKVCQVFWVAEGVLSSEVTEGVLIAEVAEGVLSAVGDRMCAECCGWQKV